MKRGDIDTFEKLDGQLMSLYEELSVLSKKSPNDGVSKFKLKFINDLVSQANEFLGAGYHPFGDFQEFREDDVPQNSDVVFILSQYLQCFEKLRADNATTDGARWYWIVDQETKTSGKPSAIATIRPKRIR